MSNFTCGLRSVVDSTLARRANIRVNDITSKGTNTNEGPLIIDNTSSEALLVRKVGDNGDVFTVDTNSPSVISRADNFTFKNPSNVVLSSITHSANEPHFIIGSSASSIPYLQFSSSNTSTQNIYFNDQLSNKGYIQYNHNFNIMKLGIEGVDRLDISTTAITGTIPFGLPVYTVASAPSASVAGHIAYFSNGAGGSPVMAFSDGSHWIRCDNRAIITT